ncbi:hypothetical protein BVD23_03375 [Salmonella enterica]|nr:hypothetical protein [Salmonella enterica]EBI7616300.1 hypothetical protein [Salmonella enterica]EBI8097963.1 hypothetical protein [Salmonella enterica]EBK3005220.1 hypothetical protein [Salmonella enterica]EBK9149863.1 hypothetical protein [Salmonella enterica]
MLLLSPLTLSSVWVLSLIHFILQAACVLTAFTHPSHVLLYAPGGALCLQAGPFRASISAVQNAKAFCDAT